MTEVEETKVPITTVAFGFTEGEERYPFVAIGPLDDDTFAGYVVDQEQVMEALHVGWGVTS